jgi:hypothetical protein
MTRLLNTLNWVGFHTTILKHYPVPAPRARGIRFAIKMDRNMLEITKIEAEIVKMLAETSKINREARWYPLLAVAAIIGAGAALAKLFV